MRHLKYTWPWIRIDKRLSEQLPYSRSFFAHLFGRQAVHVWERVVKKSYTLKEWDEVVIDSLERFIDGGILEECPARDIEIQLEKDDYMVITKPRWVLSHPNSVRDVQHPSVVWWVYHLMKFRNTNQKLPSTESFIRAGLVHRLDKETTGLMIIAKTEKWLEYFKKLFQEKSLAESIDHKEQVMLKKFYRAVCHVSSQWQSFLNAIVQFPHYIIEDVIPQVPYPVVKEGITKILSSQVVDNDKVLLDIEILTGRTHQIRYHLSRHGLPVVGDYVYGDDDNISMQLEAVTLVFVDPEWELVTIST